VIAYLSRQVLNLEVAYAAFCGVITVVIPGPRLAHGSNGIAQYARAVKEALSGGMYLQLHIQMPMDSTKSAEAEDDLGDLACFTRPEYLEQSVDHGSFTSWDAWNTLRSVCKYHNRLSLGKYNATLSLLCGELNARNEPLWWHRTDVVCQPLISPGVSHR
jgi:protein arginine N-methyltransferase 5